MCSQRRLRLASLSVTSESDADTSERLRDLAFSGDLTRLTEIALKVLSGLRSFEQIANLRNTKLDFKEQVAEFESRLIRSVLIKTEATNVAQHKHWASRLQLLTPRSNVIELSWLVLLKKVKSGKLIARLNVDACS